MACILALAVAFRFRHWMLPVPEGKTEDVNRNAARLTGFMVVLLSCTQAAFYLTLAFDLDGMADGTVDLDGAGVGAGWPRAVGETVSTDGATVGAGVRG